MCTSNFNDVYDFAEDEFRVLRDTGKQYYDYFEDLVTGKSTQNPLQELYEPLEYAFKNSFSPIPFIGGNDNEYTDKMEDSIEEWWKEDVMPRPKAPSTPAPAGPPQPTAASQQESMRGGQAQTRSYGANALRVGGRNYGGL